MKKRIRQKIEERLSENFLEKLKAKRRKKADLDKKRYHEFYSLASMPPEEWAVVQAKKKGKLQKA